MFHVVVMPQAERDMHRILQWLERRSPAGAAAWYLAYSEAVQSLHHDPQQWAIAEESPRKRRAIRNRIFRTSQGRPYRLAFTVNHEAKVVVVLHVRATGQPPIS